MTVSVTNKEFEKLKLLYSQAVKEKKDQFEFKGSPILVSYAKYLIEYLTPRITCRQNQFQDWA
jgi:hypothetical protein